MARTSTQVRSAAIGISGSRIDREIPNFHDHFLGISQRELRDCGKHRSAYPCSNFQHCTIRTYLLRLKRTVGDVGNTYTSYTRIGSNKGKTPEHNQAKHTKHPHSLEWHNSIIHTLFAAVQYLVLLRYRMNCCRTSRGRTIHPIIL